MEGIESGLEIDKSGNAELDDDGKLKRTGTMWTASAHIITSVIGSGVLSLAWGMAQLGWIAGVSTLVIFSFITLYTSNLLADAYRSPITGSRNHTYTQVVRNNLGQLMYTVCATVQHGLLAGLLVGYTITAAISMVYELANSSCSLLSLINQFMLIIYIRAIHKSDCYHIKGHEAACSVSTNYYIIGMGILEIFLSQIPNFHKLSFLSVVAAVMSFAYSSISAGLSFAKLVSGKGGGTSLGGAEIGIGLSVAEKIWRVCRSLGDIAFAYSYCVILIEVQDTLKATPPENVVMKKANAVAVWTTTAFYMMCGCFGYAAFGNNAPGNLLTGFGSYGPFWLVDIANACVVVHLFGAYQVCAQPIFNVVELWSKKKFPKSKFVTAEYTIGFGKCKFNLNLLRLIWRSLFVALATVVALILPFFNDVLAFLGAIGYWPLTVFFPIELYITQNKIRRWTRRWISLQLINTLCLLVALAAACGSIQGFTKALQTYTPFKFDE